MTLPLTSPFTHGVDVDKPDLDQLVTAINTVYGIANLYYGCNATFSKSITNNSDTALTAITKTTEVNNTGGSSPFSGGTFTAPSSRFYAAMIGTGGIASAGRTTARIVVNGTEIIGNDTTNGGTGRAAASHPAIWLNAGDTLTFNVYQNSGGTVTMAGTIAIKSAS